MRVTGMSRIEVKSMIRSALAPTDAFARALGAASGNDAYVSDLTIGNPGAAPSSYIYGAVLLTAQVSGIFAFGWGVPFNSGTTADSITMAAKTVGWTKANWAGIATTGKIALTGATAVGVVGPAAGPAINAGSAPGCYDCTTPGTGITATVTGANSTTVTQESKAYGTLTGLLTANGMQWDSGNLTAQNGTSTTKTPFAIGSPALVEFLVSATNTISMTGSGFFWAEELAAN